MLKGLIPLALNLILLSVFLMITYAAGARKKSRRKKKDNFELWVKLSTLILSLFFIFMFIGLAGKLLGQNLAGAVGAQLADKTVAYYGWLPAIVTSLLFTWMSLMALFSKLTTKLIARAFWLNLLAFAFAAMLWSISAPKVVVAGGFAHFVTGVLFPLIGRFGTFAISLLTSFFVLRWGLNIRLKAPKVKTKPLGQSLLKALKSAFGAVVGSISRIFHRSGEEKPVPDKVEPEVEPQSQPDVGEEPSASPEDRDDARIIIFGTDGKREVRLSELERSGKTLLKPKELESVQSVQGDVLNSIDVPFDRLLSMLSRGDGKITVDESELRKNARMIEEKLEEFGVKGKVVGYYPGPVVTRYEYEPAPGVKLSRITNLADDLALRMKTHKIRIVAPLADKGLIGIEVPNRKRRIVYLRELLERREFREQKHKLFFALGVDTAGKPFYTNLARMPHLLIAGATGSGKSVSINTIISSFLFRARPSELRMLLIDPKRIELSYYEGVPHLLLPVVKDRKVAGSILKQAVMWMELRYKHFARDGVRDIESHNSSAAARGDNPLPYIVIIIDEFADLILTIGKDIEEPLARLAQMARAVGIHLIVATQRPSVDVITGIIKANFPVRIAFKVPSKVDSRTILDEIGAEKLLGMGDMLFIPPGTSEPIRLHGPFVSEEETRRIAQTYTRSYLMQRLLREFGNVPGLDRFVDRMLDNALITAITRDDEPGSEERFQAMLSMFCEITDIPVEKAEIGLKKIRSSYYIPIPEMKEAEEKLERELPVVQGLDPLIKEAIRLATARGEVSATMLQRKLRVGFARAARIVDQMEELGIVAPQEGSRPRRVMMSFEDAMRLIKGSG